MRKEEEGTASAATRSRIGEVVSISLPNDDCTDIGIVRPSSYGWAQADGQKISRKKKNPIGFAPPAKPSVKRRPKAR